MTNFTLTDDQSNALDMCVGFLVDPEQPCMVFSGYSGTGKSTLVATFLDRLPGYIRAAKLIDPHLREYELQLTATTHKAAENFATITGMEVSTIHSFLNLKLDKDLKTSQSKLVPKKWNQPKKQGFLILIDEASYIDSALLELIFEWTTDCKIIFIGDPAQLLLPKSSGAPVFLSGFPEARLTKVVRQAAGNPIVELSTMFRNVVNGEPWGKFKPDGQHVIHLDRQAFGAAIKAEFLRPDWKYRDSKILCWTNDRVVDYNGALRKLLTGDPELQPGDYAEVNAFVAYEGASLKNGQMVEVTRIEPDTLELGCPGNWVTLDGSKRFFHPKTIAGRKAALREAKEANGGRGDWTQLSFIDGWVDLRAVFAQTVNKSQGSTYDRVYFDLDDLKKCHNGNTLARLLYVGTSRARHQCFFVGDFGK